MRVLLKQCSTGLWLKSSGEWEPDSIDARQFASSHEAILFSEKSCRRDVNLCFLFDDRALNFEMAAQRSF
jgi:hypothetical protein